MIRKNVFQVGNIVSGESFIGRRDILEVVRERALSAGEMGSMSLVGLTRTGKSSVVFNACDPAVLREFGIIYVLIDLNEEVDYISFWKSVVSEIHDQVYNIFRLEDRRLYGFFEQIEQCVRYEKLKTLLKNLFKQLKALHRPVLLVIDEFDGATKVFERNKHYFELLRTLTSYPMTYGLTAIVVSRRSLHVIEECTPGNSTFHGIYEAKPISGFLDDDMVIYYTVLESYDIFLDDEQKKLLQFYCGRLPYLLSLFGSHLVEAKLKCDEFPSMEFISNKLSYAIHRYHEDVLNQLVHDQHLDLLINLLEGKAVASEIIEMFKEMGLVGDYYGTPYTVTPHFTAYLQKRRAFPTVASVDDGVYTPSQIPVTGPYFGRADHVTVVSGNANHSAIGTAGAVHMGLTEPAYTELFKHLESLLNGRLEPSDKAQVEEAMIDLQQNKKDKAINVLSRFGGGTYSPLTQMVN